MKILFCIIFITGIFASCKKDSVLIEPVEQIKVTQTKMLWVTPTGITIPFEESHRWEEYVAEKLGQTKSDPPKKKYESFYCSTPTVNCGLTCIESRYSTCTSAFECTPCVNCPCSE
jgi:hypothetical protein